MRVVNLVAHSALLSLVVAYPHDHLIKKRAGAVVTFTVFETVLAPDYVVWVDESGNVVSEGVEAPAPTPPPDITVDTPASAVAAPTVVAETAPPAPEAEVAEEESQDEQPPNVNIQVIESPADETGVEFHAAAAPSSDVPITDTDSEVLPEEETPPQPEPDQVDSDDSDKPSQNSSYGIGWSNYKGTEGNSPCKTFEDADKEWSQMTDYNLVRVYGADCGQPGVALRLAKKYNKKVFVGVYFLDDSLHSQVQTIIDGVHAAGTGWDPIDTVSIGNEDVHRGEKTPHQIFTYIASAKALLQAAGYTGPVVHVDSQDAILAQPELCSENAGDYIAANVHPFFNAQTAADNAGEFVQSQIELLRQCGVGQRRRRRDEVRVRVTETGWPKDGLPNGAAVPGKSNQIAAMDSIKNVVAEDVIMFSAFNNYWMKNDASTFNTEHYWGLLDD